MITYHHVRLKLNEYLRVGTIDVCRHLHGKGSNKNQTSKGPPFYLAQMCIYEYQGLLYMTLSEQIYKEVSKEAPSCLMKEGREYTIHELIQLLFHPRGIEHAITSGFPTIELLKAHADELHDENVLLFDGGQGNLHLSGGTHLIAGDCLLSIDVERSDAGVTTLVFMHGVKATVWAGKYATVKVYADTTCSVDVVNEDDTALVL